MIISIIIINTLEHTTVGLMGEGETNNIDCSIQLPMMSVDFNRTRARVRWAIGAQLFVCTCAEVACMTWALSRPYQLDEARDFRCVLGLSLGLCRRQERPERMHLHRWQRKVVRSLAVNLQQVRKPQRKLRNFLKHPKGRLFCLCNIYLPSVYASWVDKALCMLLAQSSHLIGLVP